MSTTTRCGTALALLACATVTAGGTVLAAEPAAELGNNLSFATTFIPSTAGAPTLRLACPDVPSAPSGPMSPVFIGYWLQKTEATWQAACRTAVGAQVTASWGANLLGDAPLKAGRPIRVEMALTEAGGDLGIGYVVTKLTPDLDDRLATYGTNGAQQTTDFSVWDAGSKLMIEKCASVDCLATTATIADITATAEINSVGKVVYGYNWGTKGKATAPTAGVYRVTFTTNATTIVSAPSAQICGERCTFVIITVQPAAGGGGGGGGKPSR